MSKDAGVPEPGFGESYLTLGWQVTLGQDPRYWLSTDPKPGSQSPAELVRVPADGIGSHTAIIAQSGSGKSFFLGRIIEEVMLQTMAHCVIFDPNADFRKIREVEKPDLWEKADYDALERKGRLPHEATREDFMSRWVKVPIRIRTGVGVRGDDYERLQIWWPSLSMAFLAEDLEPINHSDLYHCHNFVKAFGDVFEVKYYGGGESKNFIEEAREIFERLGNLRKAKEDPRPVLSQEYSAPQMIKELTDRGYPLREDYIVFDGDVTISRSEIERRADRFIESALTVTDYVNDDVKRFYFGKAREYETAGIIRTSVQGRTWGRSLQARLDVIDLPSLPDPNTRLLAIGAVLATTWEQARYNWGRVLERNLQEDTRSPIFIVVDEAHNLIPNEARSKAAAALREQFRTIAAEGRKYGLFLILVSQRPDKLDPLVLSECENKAVMKLGSASVLNVTRKMLGLDDISPKLLEKCLEFEIGRALLVGRWSPEGPKIIYSATRRTVEGGRNLRADYWAVPPEVHELNLARDPKRAAIELKTKHPGIIFTAGRRTVEDEAKTMAAQVAKRRTWIADNYPESPVHRRLQDWVVQNPTALSEEEIARGLALIMTNFTDGERGQVSGHLVGMAFDIQPPATDTDKIKAEIKNLPHIERLLENIEGENSWHIQFKVEG